MFGSAWMATKYRLFAPLLDGAGGGAMLEPATDPAAPVTWMLRRGLEVASCTVTGRASDATVHLQIESPELPIVVVQRCPSVEIAQASADTWRHSLLVRGWG